MMWKIVVFTVLATVFGVGLSAMVGGFNDVSVDDEGVQNALNFAVVQHNMRSDDTFLNQASEVVRAQRQVVSGMKYLITVKMARSTCRKNQANGECAVHTDPKMARTYLCKFTVWSRPWMGDIRLVDEKC